MNKRLKSYLILPVAALCLGALSGTVGALFAHAITFVTSVRDQYSFLIFLLPIGAVLTVFIYKLLKVEGVGTTTVFGAVKGDTKTSPMLTPAVFIASALTHLFGGSAGREGAALQIGGGLSSLVSKPLRLDDEQRKTLTMCGMAAVFSAVFGTPLAAAIFVFEVTKNIKTAYKNIFAVLLSSLSAYGIALLLRVPSEKFILPKFELHLMDFLRAVLLAGLCGAVCYIFCTSLFLSKKAFRLIRNPYLRGIVGSALIIAVTLLIGNQDYNGTGAHILAHIFEGSATVPYAFLLKILLTALTVGCGLKGGEIVPAFFVGATFGGAFALFLGLPLTLGAAIGMAVLFAGATKCPLAALMLSLELFGLNGILFLYLLISVIIGYALSGSTGLYQNPEFIYLAKLFKRK